jgi:hypothetical protein
MVRGLRAEEDEARPRDRAAGQARLSRGPCDRPQEGRTSREQITWSERGNLQGAQFYAVAGRIYETARAKGLGREIPTEWFLQDIRD